MAKKKKEIIEADVKEKSEKKVENDVNSKEKNTSGITTSIIMGVIGLILLLLPKGSNAIIGYIIGGALLFIGAIAILKYFKEQVHITSMGLISGVLYAILGLIIVLNPLSIMKLLTIILGVYLIVNGALKMHSGYMIKEIDEKKWKSLFIAGAVIIILGLVLVIDPFSGVFITQLAGGFLLVVALFDIINEYILNK